MPDGPGKPLVRMCDRWAADIEEMKRSHPGIEETPAFRRNFLGEWVVEDDALVYKFNLAKNGWDGALPVYTRGRWHKVLGVDLGYNDDSSFTQMQYHDFDPNLFITKSEKQKGMDISAVALKIKAIQKAAGEGEIEMVVIDGSNKQAVMEMQNRHGLSLYPADKTGKPDFIELMNADLIMGRVKVHEKDASPLIEEWDGLVWNDKTVKREEHPACPNHAADSALYGWRFCYQYVSKVQAAKPSPGTAEYDKDEEQRMFRETMASVERAKHDKQENIFGGGELDLTWG
jgi:hypothetical protein